MKKAISLILSMSLLTCSGTMISAAENNIYYGDINSDGTADLSDLTMLSQYLLKDIELTSDQLICADVYADNEVNLQDAALLRQYVMNDDVKLGVLPEDEKQNNDSENSVQPTQPGAGLHEVTFNDYDELSEKIENTLEELISKMKSENADTTAIENYKNHIHEKQSISIPVSDGKELQLRNEEGFSNIAFFTRELYSKPCFFFRFEDGTTNSYIRIYDISDELRSLGSVNANEFMKIKNPDSSHTYDQKTVHMEDRDIEVAFRKLDIDPRIYAYFIYDDSLVMLCCSEAKINSGFLESFSIGELGVNSQK